MSSSLSARDVVVSCPTLAPSALSNLFGGAATGQQTLTLSVLFRGQPLTPSILGQDIIVTRALAPATPPPPLHPPPVAPLPTVAYSCKAHAAAYAAAFGHPMPDGVMDVNFGQSTSYATFCLNSVAGGGWTLLLTMTSGNENFAGSVSPFQTDLNTASPSLTSPYSRDRRGSGHFPAPGDA